VYSVVIALVVVVVASFCLLLLLVLVYGFDAAVVELKQFQHEFWLHRDLGIIKSAII
jgi:hypothetical protein